MTLKQGAQGILFYDPYRLLTCFSPYLKRANSTCGVNQAPHNALDVRVLLQKGREGSEGRLFRPSIRFFTRFSGFLRNNTSHGST